MTKHFLIVFITLYTFIYAKAQDNELPVYKNLVSTNLSYAFLGSVNFSYERTFGGNFSGGIAYTNYSNAHRNLNVETSDIYNNYSIDFEVNPFARLYFQGAQKRSLFIEFIGSYSEGEAEGGIERSTNSLGYGVYNYGYKKVENIGIGTGVGYRFLLLKNKLVLEAQFGIRANLNEIWIYEVGIVRTGFKAGYRF